MYLWWKPSSELQYRLVLLEQSGPDREGGSGRHLGSVWSSVLACSANDWSKTSVFRTACLDWSERKNQNPKNHKNHFNEFFIISSEMFYFHVDSSRTRTRTSFIYSENWRFGAAGSSRTRWFCRPGPAGVELNLHLPERCCWFGPGPEQQKIQADRGMKARSSGSDPTNTQQHLGFSLEEPVLLVSS